MHLDQFFLKTTVRDQTFRQTKISMTLFPLDVKIACHSFLWSDAHSLINKSGINLYACDYSLLHYMPRQLKSWAEKPEQLDVFIEADMFLPFFLLALESVCATLACQHKLFQRASVSHIHNQIRSLNSTEPFFAADKWLLIGC